MVNWQISNAVFALKFNITLSLDKIADELIDNENLIIYYEPGTFPGLLIKIENNNENYSITLFKTGTVNVSGVKGDLNKIYNVIELLKKILKDCGVELPDPYQIKVANVIINGKFDYDNIDIEKMFKDLDDADYDPYQFPAVSVHYQISKNYKIVFNIFRNGNFIGAGIRSDMNNINQHINEIVNSFQENIIKKYAKMRV